ncbi:hypothetical protein BKI52_28240 [marine bacterium AO1-C]|nr:hypothetical protein BKI52_28240 [marine bacterium AO1-C]
MTHLLKNKLGNFVWLNNFLGGIMFLIAFTVYALTVEPTASFWDCGEFIACSYKLQAPHPPGTPFFLLVGRLFSLLAGNDVTQVAYWVNMMSVVCSAATIMLLFWSIILLGLRLMRTTKETITQAQSFTLLGSAAVGALAYTFSDSFWFSAVEAEVYAMSALFTSFVFWAMLRWNAVDNPRFANQWLLLIAYVIGLSLGVHILNLLTIPALGLVYYFKHRTQIEFWGIAKIMAISGGIILLLLIGVIAWLPALIFKVELLMVNSFGLPFNSGTWVVLLGIVVGLGYGVYYSVQKQRPQLNTFLMAFTLLLLGYGSYGVIVVRAQYDTPINMNKPDEVTKFMSYVNREQYGNVPLFSGPHYESKLLDSKPAKWIYRRVGNRYKRVDYTPKYTYDDYMLFPRLYSSRDNHPALYRQILGKRVGQKPNVADNFKFFWNHQLGHMYWRYFLWNFVGRQSDVQDAGVMLPHQLKSSLPEALRRNKANNQFFMLPLLLGLIGVFFQFRSSKPVFMINAMFFVLTGVALVLYFNAPPVEPRERDYIYVGSFYTFAIWMAFGTMALANWGRYLFKHHKMAAAFATTLGLSVAFLMALEGWDDHNRSNRVFSVNSAKNMLEGCAPDSILLVSGDNETYPLWYAQEVEGFRTDVRVCNLQLMTGPWYMEQLRRKQYKSAPLPLGLDQSHYARGNNSYLPFVAATQNPGFSKKVAKQLVEQGMDLKQYFQLLKKRDPRLKYPSDERNLNMLPTQRLVLPLNKAAILKQGIVAKNKEHLLKDYMAWQIPQKYLYKDDLAILDLLAHNDWKRPIYFSPRLGNEDYLGLQEYLQLEGGVMRLLPVKVAGARDGYVNSKLTYENLIKKSDWTGLNDPDIYYDEIHRRMISSSRESFYRLAVQLFNEKQYEKAKEVILFCLEKIPDEVVPYSYYVVPMLDILWEVGEAKRAARIGEMLAKRSDEYLSYLEKYEAKNRRSISINYSMLGQIAQMFEKHKWPQAKKYSAMVAKHYHLLQ